MTPVETEGTGLRCVHCGRAVWTLEPVIRAGRERAWPQQPTWREPDVVSGWELWPCGHEVSAEFFGLLQWMTPRPRSRWARLLRRPVQWDEHAEFVPRPMLDRRLVELGLASEPTP
jgi:hypothetical protein